MNDPLSSRRGATSTLVPSSGSDDSMMRSDPRVVAALEEYMALDGAGRRPDRDAFLARHAEVAEALADCLDGLVFVRSAAKPYSEAGLPVPPPAETEAIPPDSRLGDFRIARVLGRGGMGVVYEAEQISLGRRVALKVLPFAASIDPKQRQRFHVEAQAAAHLHHAHIVPVFAVGSDQGVDFYAMQFIEGRTLATVIRELRQLDGPVGGDDPRLAPSPSPPTPDAEPPTADYPRGASTTVVRPAGAPSGESPSGLGRSSGEHSKSLGSTGRGRGFYRAVAGLGVQAAEALDHAHGLGVLHRDIKPANLMIDGKGDLWVTDFGLARFQEDAGLTRTGDVLGTLRYMSPEQSLARRGVVDQRTDVYSLGVTLYELLCLRPAFDGKDRQEILQQIADQEPPAPRRSNPAIPRDLETIVLKAMSKDLAGRYATARDLADDLRRFLDDKPILARRPSPVEHLAKWARRHRPIVVTATSVVLLSALVGSALLGVAYQRERDHAQRALDNNAKARQALRNTFAVADALAYDAMGKLSTYDKDPYGGSFYIDALKYYQGILDLYREDPEMREMAAAAHRRIGFVEMVLRYVKKHPKFLDADAVGSYRRAIALYEAVVRENPDAPEPREGLSGTLNDFAMLLSQNGEAEEAERCYRRMVEIRRRDDPGPLQQAKLAVDLATHGMMLRRVGRVGEAREHIEQACTIWNGLAGQAQVAESDERFHIARRGNKIAMTITDAGFREEADAILAKARVLDPDDPMLLNNEAWQIVKRPGAAADQAGYAINLTLRALNRQGESWEHWNTLGVAHIRANDPRSALNALEKSRKLHDEGDANDWFPMAIAHSMLGEPEKASAWFDRANAWLTNHPDDHRMPDLLALQTEARSVIRSEDPPAIDPASPREQRLPE